MLIYVGIYSLYVQKSYQAVSDFVAATEIRLQGYVSDAQNRVRPHGTPRRRLLGSRSRHSRRQTYGPEDFSAIDGDSFFIATAVSWTPQQQGLCPGRRNASASRAAGAAAARR